MGKYRVPVHMLEEDNYSLRVQVSKLQTALHKVTEELETARERGAETVRAGMAPSSRTAVTVLRTAAPPAHSPRGLAAAARSPEKARAVMAAARSLDRWADVSEEYAHQPPAPPQHASVPRRGVLQAAPTIAPRSPKSERYGTLKKGSPERRLATLARSIDQWADVSNGPFELAPDDEVGVAWNRINHHDDDDDDDDDEPPPSPSIKPGQHRAEGAVEDRIARARRRGAALARAVAQGQSVREVMAKERATSSASKSKVRRRTTTPSKPPPRNFAATPVQGAFDRWAEPPRAPLSGEAMAAAAKEVSELSDRLARAEAKLRRMEDTALTPPPKVRDHAPAPSLEMIGREAEAAVDNAKYDRPGRGRAVARQLREKIDRQRDELEMLQHDVVGRTAGGSGGKEAGGRTPWRPGGKLQHPPRAASSPPRTELTIRDGGAPLRASYSAMNIHGARDAAKAADQIMMTHRPLSARRQRQRESARLLSMGLSAASLDEKMVGASSVRRLARSRRSPSEPGRRMPGHGRAERKAKNALFALERGTSHGAAVRGSPFI